MKKLLKGILCALLLTGCAVHAEESAETGTSEDTAPQNYSCRKLDGYNYNEAVPYSEAVPNSYYDQVLFAGDSRMGSLYLYGDHKNADVFYVTSLNLLLIENMALDEEELTEEMKESEEEITLYDILKQSTKDNIYLLFGINEIRNPNFLAYGEQLNDIVKMLREKNPNVNVYIILSYHPDKISDLPEPELSEHLEDLNQTQMDVAKENYVFYLNPDYSMNDEDGTIVDDYVYDGLHFTVAGTSAFEEFIATHVVKGETYVKEICE